MEKPEVILNLWYVYDDKGVIYFLLARAYVATGSERDKLDLLHKFAGCDHLVARWFPIPERFHTNVVSETGETSVPVIHSGDVRSIGGAEVLFEDAITELEKELPTLGRMSIGKNPLYCLTPLLLEVTGELVPQIVRSK